MKSDSVELLAPAGDFKTALAAFEAGADAVYCGLAEFSARAFAANLSEAELRNLVAYARRHGRKVYVTFNTLVDETDLETAIDLLSRLETIGPDALIVQDLGIARICRRHFPGLELHASTQLVAHNLEGVLALREAGFTRVVLARELSLDEISSIARRCGDTELECFIHGALCYSVSGLCLFGAMEKGRSGNRGKCPYCCRLPYEDSTGRKTLAFSMKDLRLGEDVAKLVEAGVASLKIEGRMKSELYVASVTRYYRQMLGNREGGMGNRVTVADLETVFSRRTTKLYFDGRPNSNPHSPFPIPHSLYPIDPDSLGHLGAPIGTVKRVTKDRDGLSCLRFHTLRPLEKHDGLQFENAAGGKPLGMGVTMMRQAISRHPVFEVSAGTDVEVLLPAGGEVETDLAKALRPGMTVYCSMSNAVKRMFPAPSFRPSDYAGGTAIDVTLKIGKQGLSCFVGNADGQGPVCAIETELQPAQHPERTFAAVEKAFSKLGETDYRLGKLTVEDPDRLFAPISILNDLRRDLVERLDEVRDRARREKVARALADDATEAEGGVASAKPVMRLKIRVGQKVPAGEWDEVIVAVGEGSDPEGFDPARTRLATPVYTAEPDFNRLRVAVKGLIRRGFVKWEASDLATLRMLKELGVSDVTADWTLYAFNSRALAALKELGVRRFVASPENVRENLQYLAESGYDVEFLAQQSTPLFVSLTRPMCGEDGVLRESAGHGEVRVFRRGGLWVTARPVPRTFDLPKDVSRRLDLSWDVAD